MQEFLALFKKCKDQNTKTVIITLVRETHLVSHTVRYKFISLPQGDKGG